MIKMGVTSNSCQVKQAQLCVPSTFPPDMQVNLLLITSSGDLNYTSLGEMSHFQIILGN